VATAGGPRVVARLRLPSPDEDPIAVFRRWAPFALSRDDLAR
jgi:hypothetical protein